MLKPEEAYEADYNGNDNQQNYSNNLQFLVFYKFEESKKKSLQPSDLCVIGMLTCKMDRDSFWFTPTHLSCENDL